MPARRSTRTAPTPDAAAVVGKLKKLSSKQVRDGMARFAIPSTNALGVSMAAMQRVAKDAGRSHELALALWDTGIYEARTVAALVDEPERVTSAQMDRWCRDFDSWAIVDTVCFKLFDRTEHALAKIRAWAKLEGEMQRRAGFVMLACVAAHRDDVEDRELLRFLPLIEKGAKDERNFVKKGVSWALRMVGRRTAASNAACVELARRLASSKVPTQRWIGASALKELASPALARKLAARVGKAPPRSR